MRHHSQNFHNGINYRFFSDLESPNKMDEKPFLEFSILDYPDSVVPELKKFTSDLCERVSHLVLRGLRNIRLLGFSGAPATLLAKIHKSAFNLQELLTSASELKYTREIKALLAEQLARPSDEFVRFFAAQIYSGKITQSIKEQFASLTKRALVEFINERISEKLKTVLANNEPEEEEMRLATAAPAGAAAPGTNTAAGQAEMIVTTPEETEAYYIVKSILRESIDLSRIASRDTQSYFGVLLDDNNRKPICRFHFNRSQKYLGLIGPDKSEQRVPIGSLNEIYKYAQQIREAAVRYEGAGDAGGHGGQ